MSDLEQIFADHHARMNSHLDEFERSVRQDIRKATSMAAWVATGVLVLSGVLVSVVLS